MADNFHVNDIYFYKLMHFYRHEQTCKTLKSSSYSCFKMLLYDNALNMWTSRGYPCMKTIFSLNIVSEVSVLKKKGRGREGGCVCFTLKSVEMRKLQRSMVNLFEPVTIFTNSKLCLI